jgi:hypothetical protein
LSLPFHTPGGPPDADVHPCVLLRRRAARPGSRRSADSGQPHGRSAQRHREPDAGDRRGRHRLPAGRHVDRELHGRGARRRPVRRHEATFTIDAGTSQVVGTKTLRESLSATCLPTPELGIEDFTDVLLSANYEATITTPTGTLVDRGRSTVAAQLSTLSTGAAGAAVQEAFDSEDLIHTPGHTAGAGLIADPVHGHVVFGYTAKSDGVTAKGKCAVVTAGTLVTCQNVTLLMQLGTHVTFLGQARVNGVPTDYRIDVDDLGEPGRDRDLFGIQTSSGFTAAGVLRAGNIQVYG